MEPNEILSPEKNVRRVNNTVIRPAQPWSPSIQQFLAFLKARGLPAETMERTGGGEDIYTFVEAEMVHPGKWSGEALQETGALLSRLHRACADFRPDPDLGCKPWCLREIGGAERIWCHGDIAPWNMLTKNARPYILVDWEFAGPLDPLVELARVCWLFVQLHDDDLRAMHDLPPPHERARQVRMLCDAYELPPQGRRQLVEQIIEVIICETAHEAIDPGIVPEDTGGLWGFAWRTRSLYWVWRHRSLLENALR